MFLVIPYIFRDFSLLEVLSQCVSSLVQYLVLVETRMLWWPVWLARVTSFLKAENIRGNEWRRELMSREVAQKVIMNIVSNFRILDRRKIECTREGVSHKKQIVWPALQNWSCDCGEHYLVPYVWCVSRCIHPSSRPTIRLSVCPSIHLRF